MTVSSKHVHVGPDYEKYYTVNDVAFCPEKYVKQILCPYYIEIITEALR